MENQIRITLERSGDVGIISTMLRLIFHRGIFKTFTIHDLYYLHHVLMYMGSSRPHDALSDLSVKLTKWLADCITIPPVANNDLSHLHVSATYGKFIEFYDLCKSYLLH